MEQDALLRISVNYLELTDLLNSLQLTGESIFPVYGSYMEGRNIYEMESFPAGILVIGNEANGIRETTETFIQRKISIPSYNKNGAESLNAAIATSLIVAEFRRKNP